jgi:hypothetical protein
MGDWHRIGHWNARASVGIGHFLRGKYNFTVSRPRFSSKRKRDGERNAFTRWTATK